MNRMRPLPTLMLEDRQNKSIGMDALENTKTRKDSQP